MAFFFDGGRGEHSDIGAVRNGDGALDVLIIALLMAFALAVWFLCGSVRPMFDATNPSLMAHPAPASGPYHATPSSQVDTP
jgi:hypothetical protein